MRISQFSNGEGAAKVEGASYRGGLYNRTDIAAMKHVSAV